ncbi:prostate-associated microseminoprotein-like [Narcine bancroftii]|uniref:prostate-associated microseminoprotein-like n=1 Tax=Narcine bancroftii TaxID=1343680 RepID=UPI003831C2B2
MDGTGKHRRRRGRALSHLQPPVCLGAPIFTAILSAATCEHRGAQLEIGDTWMKEDCYQCVCLSPFGVGCCDSIQQPVDYPEWCEVVLRPDSCQLEVVMKANPRIPCLGKSFARRLLLPRARVEENRRWIE